jgi:hypothetical protein
MTMRRVANDDVERGRMTMRDGGMAMWRGPMTIVGPTRGMIASSIKQRLA